MHSLEANIRNTKTKGELSSLRKNGYVPAILYGGKAENKKISISKKLLKLFIEKKNFLSTIVELDIDGNSENVLPREI
ncbi:MAG: 50S ribosomal protein L25, partial [Alphaproteobacteria bacterium]|nr:50S ribosomal protein L25 [Alphaproteobacteria bacterium]